MAVPPSIDHDLQILGNPARELEERAQAAERLAHALCTDALPDPRFERIVETFYTLYHDPHASPALRRRLLAISAMVPRPWHHDAIRAAWDHDDPDWREAAMVAMGYVPGFEAAIREALDDEHPPGVYRQALRAAGRRELFDAEPRLRRVAVSDTDPKSTRLAAIHALGEVAAPETMVFLETLTHDADTDIARAASHALDRLGLS